MKVIIKEIQPDGLCILIQDIIVDTYDEANDIIKCVSDKCKQPRDNSMD